MGRDDGKLRDAKRAYRKAKEEGNRQEEARWANVLGDILKNRGEYVEAIRWLRLDYEVSLKFLPEKQLLPTCQSMGEVFLRLQDFKHALIYQKKHLELAKDANDLIEQQRASTQLGRTYHEMFTKSDNDHYSIRNAKKYFKLSMKLAHTLKKNQSSGKPSFVKEYIDAYNNIGMLEIDLDNLEEAKKFLTRGLQICNEEEVAEDDDARSRLHHNLGIMYMELRRWDRAREHIEKDIIICKKIGHCQGEAKGYINLGELHYRVQKYDEAILCYQKALDLATSMEDEDALVVQINDNIKTVREATEVMNDLKSEEQKFKKLTRNMTMVRGTSNERKCLLQQYASLDRLIEKSSMIFAWKMHLGFAKTKKRVASELYDMEKISDSFLVIGESYQKLRNFEKALKWYRKGWETYKSIGNLEGQALAKINMGNVLDSIGKWADALDAFEESYRIAHRSKLPSIQLSALENMHYSQMIRFDNVEEARRLQLLIDELKQSDAVELDMKDLQGNYCSETETEGDDHPLSCNSNGSYSPRIRKRKFIKSKSQVSGEEFKDDASLISLPYSSKNSSEFKDACLSKPVGSTMLTECSPRTISVSTGSQTLTGRKRVRLVLSDDEDGNKEVKCHRDGVNDSPMEDIATFDEFNKSGDLDNHSRKVQLFSTAVLNCAINVNPEESSCSFKSISSELAAQDAKDLKLSSTNEVSNFPNFDENFSRCDVSANQFSQDGVSCLKSHSSGDQAWKRINCKIDDQFLCLEHGSFMVGSKLDIESLKVEVACLYFLQLPLEKHSKGLLPIIQHIRCGDRILESLENIDTLKDHLWNKGWIEASISVWVLKPLIKLYAEYCKEQEEPVNLKVLKKLYNLEVSEDEVIVSDCELQDISVAPLLSALNVHKNVAVLDLSHNLLGNRTMEKLQQMFTSSGQRYGGLVLDLHSNRFGPSSLFQICECSVLFTRLEVLNISGNRLTDSCASYLSTILQNCKALYSLNIELCSITSRTIQKVADSLDSGSVLTQLCIGYNQPVSGNAITNLLLKLSKVKRFSDLNLNGLKLGKPAMDSLCQLAKDLCLSGLMLGSTGIGTDRALQVTESLLNETQEVVKLDLSFCGLTSQYIVRLNEGVSHSSSIVELNLGGNAIMPQGGNELASLLKNPKCCLRVLGLNKCQLGLVGILHILQSLSKNCLLEELDLSENVNLKTDHSLLDESKRQKDSLNSSPANADRDLSSVDKDCRQPDAPEKENKNDLGKVVEGGVSGLEEGSMNSSQKSSSNSEFQMVQDLSSAISMAEGLAMLDLSRNGFSEQVAETLYASWSSHSRAASAHNHIHQNIIHFSLKDYKCCRWKPCCRRI